MKQRSNPFLSFNWNWFWCKHYLQGEGVQPDLSLCLAVGRKNGEVDMIWPLLLLEKWGMRVLSFMGAPVSQYGDVLCDDGPDQLARLSACWDFLRRRVAPDVFVARKVRADSAIAPFFQSSRAITTNVDQAPYADLGALPDFAAYEARFSKKFRRNARRQNNRLNEHGDLSFEVYRESGDASDLVGAAIDMKSEWLRQNGQISPGFTDKRFRAFFQDIAGAQERPTGCTVSVLRLDDRPVAIEIGVASDGHYSAHIGTFDPQFAALSPGTQQMRRTIEELMGERIHTYDLLAPNSNYKQAWTDASIDVFDYVVPNSAMGKIYANFYLKWTRPGIKLGLAALSSGASKVRLISKA